MRVAALYPGQGSQHPGMGKFLYDEFKIAKECFEEASEALKLDLKKLLFDGSEAELALTHNTQPALLLVSVASFRTLASLAEFDVVAGAGHSVGEYAALVCSKALSLNDAIRAVRRRGELMQTAVPVGEGAMLAVLGLDSSQVESLCRWASAGSQLVVEPANFNAPGQIVISGHAKAMTWIEANFSENAFPGAPKRLKAIPLKVSAPFHCQLMKPAEVGMRQVLSEMQFSNSKYPIIQNFTARAVQEANQLRENLIKQISGPVRWIECVQGLIALEIPYAIEFGSGKVLNGLVKKIDSERLTTLNMNSMDELRAIETFLSGKSA